MAMHITRPVPDVDFIDDDRIVELTGRVVARPLRRHVLPIPEGGLAADHPALLLLREVAELRRALAVKEGEVSAAYERECELIRVLHRYVLKEQSEGS